MDATVAGLIGTAIGGGVAILTAFIQGWNQRKLEKEKEDWPRETTIGTELRTHLATVARELLAAQAGSLPICHLVISSRLASAM